MTDDQPKPGIKQALRRIVPASLLRERDTFIRLGPKAGPLYARFRALDALRLLPQRPKGIPPAAQSFLFVCHGNIMRSPMAALMLREAWRSSYLPKIETASAGLHAIEDNPAHPQALEASLELGLPLTEHRARLLTPDLVSQADVIFVMDFQNLAEMLVLYANSHPKIYMLSDYAEGSERYREIPDPYFGDLDTTRQCYRTLQKCVSNLVTCLTTQPERQALSQAGLHSPPSGSLVDDRT